jgi:ABC-type multidrug transport system ATPase subunit
MIEITNLTKHYGGAVQALREVDLQIGPGMFGLVGPNGAGKTTLMRILAGLLTPSGGQVRVFGHDLGTTGGKQAVKAVLGYLPQELGLYPNLTGREFLDYVAVLKGATNGAARRAQIAEVLDLVRLADVADRAVKTYSGGMKRRLGVAQALLGTVRLLIVDEPTVGLDPEERVRLRTVLATMAQRCTVILSTHIVEDISQSCNDLALLYGGQVRFRGAPAALIAGARGHVWTIPTGGDAPAGDLAIVSMLQLQDGVQYRVVGTPAPGQAAIAAEPSLEDGYIWLMRQAR